MELEEYIEKFVMTYARRSTGSSAEHGSFGAASKRSDL